MSIAFHQRLKALEDRVSKLEAEETVEAVVKTTNEKGRGMCPKCGVKPNYHFHVKTCTGQKDGDKATDQHRDSS